MPGGFAEALSSLFTLDGLLLLAAGTVVGLLSGLIPGLGGLTGMAMFLPLTLAMSPAGALLFFAGLMGGPRFTGAILSILINIPGSTVNAATSFDGYPMARKGQADRALSIAATSSILGTIFGLLVLLAVMPGVLGILKTVGPHELFALAFMAVVMVAFSASTDANGFAKGIASGGVGLLIGLMGVATVAGTPRFNFGSTNYLYDGIGLIPLFIGVFAIAQVLRFTADHSGTVAADVTTHLSRSGIRDGITDTFRSWRVVLQGATIGGVVGLLPGIGGVAANFLAYSAAKGTSKAPERFGKGAPEGIAAPESSNNSDMVASIVPTVSFGIPGGAEGVLIIGLLTLHGFITGPLLLQQHPEVLWILLVGAVLAALVTSVLCLMGVRSLARLALVPLTYIVPVVVVASLFGVYSDQRNVLDIALAIGIGIASYFVMKSGFSAASLVIGYVLAPIIEDSFVLGWQSENKSYLSFFTSPISIVIWVSIVALVVWSVVSTRRQLRKSTSASTMSEPGAVEPATDRGRIGLIVTGLLILFVGSLVLEATGLSPIVRLVPLVIGIPTLALLVVILIVQLRTHLRARRTSPPPDTEGVGGGSVGVITGTSTMTRRRLLAGLAWLVTYTVLIFSVGFLVASVLAVFTYVAYDLSTTENGPGRRQVIGRAVALALGVGLVLFAAQQGGLAMFGGVLFGYLIPPW